MPPPEVSSSSKRLLYHKAIYNCNTINNLHMCKVGCVIRRIDETLRHAYVQVSKKKNALFARLMLSAQLTHGCV